MRGFARSSFALNERNQGAYALVAIPRPLKTFLMLYKKNIGYVVTIGGERIYNPKKSWRTACEKAGIKADMKSLRHTNGSWLKQDGIPSAFIAESMGHSDTKMIDNTYGHMNKTYLEVIRKAKWGKVA